MADAFASERKAYRAHIKHLEGEVAHLRTLLNNALGLAPDGAPLTPVAAMGTFDSPSEDEEEIREMFESGLIDDEEAKDMLRRAGALNTDIDLTIG
jgi:hypothetical protein